MEKAVQEPDGLKVALFKTLALASVHGRGSFKLAAAFKRFGLSALEHGATRLLLDMNACTGMDSTFMGVLAGLAMLFAPKADHGLILMNLSPRNSSLLATLGLNRLVEMHAPSSLPEAIKKDIPDLAELTALDATAGKRLTLETMLAAHEDLVKASPSNLLKFQNVLDYLRADLSKNGDDSCSSTSP